MMILILRERGSLDSFFVDSPLKKVITFVKENTYLWNEQEEKLPVLQFTDYEVSLIDDVIRKSTH